MSEDYLRLESLVQRVVSPYLGTHGLYSGGGSVAHCSCVLGKKHTLRCSLFSHYVFSVLCFLFSFSYTLCLSLTEKRLQWCWPKQPVDQPSKNPVVRSKSYNIPLLLTPVAEYDPDASSVGSGGIRRHSACEIISCLEEQGLAYADMASRSDASTSSASSNRLCVVPQFRGRSSVLLTRFTLCIHYKLQTSRGAGWKGYQSIKNKKILLPD